MTRNSEFDVVIMGFGPAGAVAACWLGQAGVKTLVVEKSRTIWEIPRAMALDHEILRIFQNIGVVEKVLPHTAPFGASALFLRLTPKTISLTWYSRSRRLRRYCAGV